MIVLDELFTGIKNSLEMSNIKRWEYKILHFSSFSLALWFTSNKKIEMIPSALLRELIALYFIEIWLYGTWIFVLIIRELKLKIHVIYCIWLLYSRKKMLGISSIIERKWLNIFPWMVACWGGFSPMHGGMLRWVHIERNRLYRMLNHYRSGWAIHFFLH